MGFLSDGDSLCSLLCVGFWLVIDTMDQSKKRNSDPCGIILIVSQRIEANYFLFSFPLLIIFLSGFFFLKQQTGQISGCSTGSTVSEAGTSPATDGRTSEEINECGVN